MKKLQSLRIMLSVLLVFSTLSLHAQKKIYVLSDLHVMAPELLVSDGDAWQKYLADDRKMVDKSQPIFDALSEKILAEQPDLVLITGDLTKDGEVLSHQYVSSKLKSWQAAGIATLVIPGNHDFGTSFSRVYDGASSTAAEVLDEEGYKELYEGMGYFDHSSVSQKGFTALSYWQEPLEGLIVVGLDSHTGSISDQDVAEACRRIRWARHDGYEVLVMMHHGLIPHFYKEENYMDDALVTNHEAIKEQLLAAGAHIVLTGHFHTSDIARDYNTDLSQSIVDISTGSPISYPCDYRILTYDPESKDITVATESVTELEGIDDFAAYAKERSLASNKQTAERYIKQMVNEIAPNYASYLTYFLDSWCNALAKAFILHAEGNEGDADASEKSAIREALALPIQLMPEAGDMLTSLLEDQTPYDPEGQDPRCNVTDDRTLTLEHGYVTIGMGTPSTDELLRRAPQVPSAATLYYGEENLVVPEGVTVYTVKLGTDGDLKTVEQSELYLEDEVIPAGTAVIVQGVINPYDYCSDESVSFEDLLAQRRDYAIPSSEKCTFRTTTKSGAEDAANVLRGSDTPATTTGPDAAAYKYYKLCWNKDTNGDETLGFYFQEAGGAAFTSGAHKAYLAVPADSAADVYHFDDLTGIHTVSATPAQSDGIYTLSGVRMTGRQLPKGLYIVRGKKMVIR